MFVQHTYTESSYHDTHDYGRYPYCQGGEVQEAADDGNYHSQCYIVVRRGVGGTGVGRHSRDSLDLRRKEERSSSSVHVNFR